MSPPATSRFAREQRNPVILCGATASPPHRYCPAFNSILRRISTEASVARVVCDLPDRDCAALASNGELSIAGGDTVTGPHGTPVKLTGSGLQESENEDPGYNANIPPGSSYKDAGFVGTWNNATNPVPTGFALHGTACTVN